MQSTVTQLLAQSTSLADATPELLRITCEEAGWDLVEMWLVDHNASLLRLEGMWHAPFVDAVEFETASLGATTTADRGLPGRVWASGRPEWVSDVTTQPDFVRRSIAAAAGIHTALAIPICSGTKITGVLVFFSCQIRERDPDLLRATTDLAKRIESLIEAKRSEEDIARLLHQREAITEAIQDILYVVDTAGKLTWWNKRFETITALSPAELSGRPALAFFPEEEQRVVAEGILAVFEKGAAEMDVSLLTTAGPVPYHFKGVILRDADGAVIGLTGVGRDISERKRSEEAAQRWTNLYETLFKAQGDMGEGIMIIQDRKVVYANDAVTRIHGYGVSELISLPTILDLVVPEERDSLVERFTENGSGTSSGHHGETTILHRDGHRVQIEYSVRPVSIGDQTQMFAVIRDVTERRQAEEALRESEARYRQLIDLAPDAVVVHSEGKIIFANSAAAALIGAAEPDQLAGRSVLDFIHPDQRAASAEAMRQVMEAAGGPFRSERTLLRLDGTAVDVEMAAASFLYRGRIALQVLIRDVSERKRAEEDLKERDRQLVQAQKLARLGHWHWDMLANKVSWSNELYDIFGVRPEEFAATFEAYVERIYPDDRAFVTRIIQDAAQDLQPFTFEERIVRPDGAVRTLHSQGEVVTDESGHAVSMMGICQDITERKQVEDALRRETLFVKLLQVVAVNANLASNIEETLQIALDQICHYTGWPVGHVYRLDPDCPDVLAPTSIWSMESSEDSLNFRRVTEGTPLSRGVGLPGRVLASGEPAWIVDASKDTNLPRARAANEIGVKAGFAFPVFAGKEVAAVLEFFSLDATDPDGQLLEVMGHIGSQLGAVIERKQAEDALAEALRERDNIMQTIPDIIYTLDLKGNLVKWNKRMETVTGFSPEELMNRPATAFFPADEQAYIVRQIAEAFAKGYAEVDANFLKKDGTTIPYEWTGVPLTDAEGNVIGLTGAGRDITERRTGSRSDKQHAFPPNRNPRVYSRWHPRC